VLIDTDVQLLPRTSLTLKLSFKEDIQAALGGSTHQTGSIGVVEADDLLLLLQLPLLKERWKTIVLGALFQYVHAMATQLAHRMHRPMVQPLHDVGFDLLPVSARRCHSCTADYAALAGALAYNVLVPLRQPGINVPIGARSWSWREMICALVLKWMSCLSQELGKSNEWVSELIFTSLFVSFVLWTFSPFVFPKKRFYTAVLYSRILCVLVGKAF
jgi:hypothetical protein